MLALFIQSLFVLFSGVSVGFCMLCEFRNHVLRVTKHHPQNGPIRPMTIIQRLSCKYASYLPCTSLFFCFCGLSPEFKGKSASCYLARLSCKRLQV